MPQWLALTRNILEIVPFKILRNGISVLTELHYCKILLESNNLLAIFNCSCDHQLVWLKVDVVLFQRLFLHQLSLSTIQQFAKLWCFDNFQLFKWPSACMWPKVDVIIAKYLKKMLSIDSSIKFLKCMVEGFYPITFVYSHFPLTNQFLYSVLQQLGGVAP